MNFSRILIFKFDKKFKFVNLQKNDVVKKNLKTLAKEKFMMLKNAINYNIFSNKVKTVFLFIQIVINA